jgi:hypothetical protein
MASSLDVGRYMPLRKIWSQRLDLSTARSSSGQSKSAALGAIFARYGTPIWPASGSCSIIGAGGGHHVNLRSVAVLNDDDEAGLRLLPVPRPGGAPNCAPESSEGSANARP